VPPDESKKARVINDLLVDFEGPNPGAIQSVTPGGGWYSFNDSEMGISFTPAPEAWMVSTPGHGGTGFAVHVAGSGFIGSPSDVYWGGGTGFRLGGPIPGGLAGGPRMTAMPTDVSAYTGISFYAKSSMASDVSVQFPIPDTVPDYCTCRPAGLCYGTHFALIQGLAADWTKYTVKFADLKQPPEIKAPIPFDRVNLLEIDFMSNGPVPMFDFWIDDISLIR
jgi:hypothetical protein